MHSTDSSSGDLAPDTVEFSTRHREPHAVTVVGYALSKTVPPVSEPQVGLTISKGRRVEKLYVHDDGVGPFAKMVPQILPAESKDWKIKPPFMLESEDPADKARYTLQPWFVLVPAYGKMRITYTEASTWAWKFSEVLSTLGLGDRIAEWCIYLTDTQRLKSEVRAWTTYHDKLRILEMSQPRFIWRMQAMKGDDCLIELLLDATGVLRSCQLFEIIWHDEVFKSEFQTKISLLPKSDFEQEYPKRFADLCYRN
jgi:hypothetical protein